MPTAALALPRPVLADRLPRSLVVDAALVVGAALLTAAAAQVTIPLAFSPAPISGITFAVLLTGAALGPARGGLSQVLYFGMGAAGLPFYADGASGLTYALGATGGYLLAFPIGAVVVGALARRGWDRRVAGTAAAFALASLLFYAIGAPWMAVVAGMTPSEAFLAGVAPFVVGDVLKAALAAAVLPSAWALLGRAERREADEAAEG